MSEAEKQKINEPKFRARLHLVAQRISWNERDMHFKCDWTDV